MKTTNLSLLKNAMGFYTYLLIVWGFYRLLLQAPAPLEELLVKPVVWLLPLFYLIRKERASLASIGITFQNFFPVTYFVLSLGLVFSMLALVVNYLKYGGVRFTAFVSEEAFLVVLLLSFITAFTEEAVFRGYLLTRLLAVVKKQFSANIIISIGWSLIHLPIAIFDWRLTAGPLVVYIVIIFLFSVGATHVFLRTRNIIAPILLHVLWQWPIILFR